jgi:hypothetical protein
MRYCRVALTLFATAWFLTGVASAQTAKDKEFQIYMDLMRKDIRTQKQSLVDQGMELEAAQKSQFWGIYDGYQKALTTIGDQRVANIKKYADNIDKMTDVIADELAVKMIDIEAQRTALKKKYYAEFKAKMGARLAARFLQVETTIGLLLDLQIASEVPILQ